MIDEKLKQKVRNLIGDKFCLLVEPSEIFSSSIQSCLTELGIPSAQIITSRKFEEAKKIITEKRPILIVTEYDLPQGGYGLTLLELQESLQRPNERMSIIVTSNSTNSAVAEAAEGAVDAFVLKPFSTDDFRKKLLEVLEKKFSPTPYTKKIQDGQEELISKAFQVALDLFTEAKPLNPKPTLAHFYSGQAHQGLGDSQKALAEYREGRKYQPLHYKCLIGEFEGLMDQKKYDEAYSLVPLIEENYPITSHRLGQIFIAAVFTSHFDDLDNYYHLYTKVENRSPRLIELTSLALFTAGKYWLQKREMEKMLHYFELALLSRSREFKFLEAIVNECLKGGCLTEAEILFGKALPSEVGSLAHSQLRFKLDQTVMTPEELAEKGRKFIGDGTFTPEILRATVVAYAKIGKETMAESMLLKGAEKFPEMKSELYEIVKKNLMKKP